ncbi:unnamed protein product [Parnassius mnemosyne]
MGWSAPIIPKLQDPKQSPLSSSISETETSLVGSITYVGLIIGPYITGYLSNAIGRKPSFFVAGLLTLLSFLLLANANNLAMIFTGRVICGLGTGMIYVVNLVYIGEIASTNIRGILLTSTNIFTTLGTLFVYAVGPYVSYPVVSYIAVGVTALYILGILFIPESPTYYILKERTKSAQGAMDKLGRLDELDEILAVKYNTEKLSVVEEWKQMITVKSNRKALFITLSLSIFQQTSGIIVVIFFATTIFETAGSSIEPNVATIIIGVTQFVASMLSSFFVERMGRRILLLCSTTIAGLSMATLGVYFYLDLIDHSSISMIKWLPLVSLIIYFLFYDFGFGIIPGTLIGEMYQSNVRSIGSTVSITVAWLFGFGVATVYGYMVSDLGSHITFWMFSGMCALACLFTAIFVPETKGKSLAEIQQILNK